MKKDIAQRWSSYLRMPGIKQAREHLAEGGGSNARCCLGHLCDIAVTEGVIEAPREVRGEPKAESLSDPDVPEFRKKRNFLVYGEGDWWGDLPDEVVKWAGMKTRNGLMEKNKGANTNVPDSLSSMNDRGVLLLGIANIIDKYWEEL